MASVNKAIIVGNIGKDPVVRNFANGKVVQFSVATSKKYREASGEMKEETAWHNIKIAGKSAESFEKCGVKKGTPIYLEGEITNRSWTDQTTGQKRYTTEINVSSFQILSSRNSQGTSGNGASNGGAYGASQQTRPQPAYNESDEDDLPF